MVQSLYGLLALNHSSSGSRGGGAKEDDNSLPLLYVYFTSCYTSNVFQRSRVRGINAFVFFIYILSIMCMSSLSSPPHLVRPASHPFSGKNFCAVCSGVVGVPLDELLPPSVPLASLVLGCARPVAE
jgi:hypothetical protein